VTNAVVVRSPTNARFCSVSGGFVLFSAAKVKSNLFPG